MSTLKKKSFHLWFSKLRRFPAALNPSSPPHTPNKKPLSLENSTSTAADDCCFSDESTSDSDSDADAVVPDFSAAVASHRFFLSSPGFSNSIFDSSPDHAVKVRKVSTDPFVDFRGSMQEMIEARNQPVDVRRDWEYLLNLLICYLQINSLDTHKFITTAFSDLLIYLLESSPESPSDHRLRRRNCHLQN
ncbi:transcription repressor OFP12-like [Cucurbita pepo subsp. pepo]|uniref:transcription repressor OFP12-like n=1 Tax=Cucurbita pepo subsp. pepo TaxID=3664 RepID=UPI000C9D3630|nr:transcription repressor OFP12-like [Cucurbita pepo subsp. pepo]